MAKDFTFALQVSQDSLAQIDQNFAFTECLPRLGLPEPIEITPVTTIALFEIVFVLLPFQCFLIDSKLCETERVRIKTKIDLGALLERTI